MDVAFWDREPVAGHGAGRVAWADKEGVAGRRVYRAESCYWVTVAGSVPPSGRGSVFIDRPRASRPVSRVRIPKRVARRVKSTLTLK